MSLHVYLLLKKGDPVPYAKVLTKHPLHMGWGQREENFDKSFFLEGIVYRRLKCRRELPPYPYEQARWLPKLELAYAHARLKNGICPHKGVNLRSCPIMNGIVTCPAHGLRWQVDSGELGQGTI